MPLSNGEPTFGERFHALKDQVEALQAQVEELQSLLQPQLRNAMMARRHQEMIKQQAEDARRVAGQPTAG